MIDNKIKNEINNLSLEMKLMFLLAVKEIEKREICSINKILEQKLNWDLFLSIVEHHRTYPIICKNLNQINKIHIPEHVISRLQQLYKLNMVNSLKFTGELIRLMNLMQQNKIRAIPLKGSLLGMAIYGEISLRTSRDLDILIDYKDIEKVEKILIEIGYKRVSPDFYLTIKQKKMLIKKDHHFEYFNSKLNICLELHWRYDSECFLFDFEDIWKQRNEVTISGHEITTLCPEDNFLYLVFHGAKHGWFRLRWLCDVYEIIKINQLNWERVVEKAGKLQILHMLLQCMILVHFIFKVDIPNKFKALIENNKKAYSLAEMAMPFIKTLEKDIHSQKSELYIYNRTYMFKLVYGIKSKVKYLLQYLYPNPEDFKVIQFSDRFFILYFIGRPFFWIYRFL